MADAKGGFNATLYILLGVGLAFLMGGMLLCGGCMAILGIGTVAVQKTANVLEDARDKARERRDREEAKRAEKEGVELAPTVEETAVPEIAIDGESEDRPEDAPADALVPESSR